MCNAKHPLHPTRHSVTVSGEAWSLIEVCLIELHNRELEANEGKPTLWVKKVIAIAQAFPTFALAFADTVNATIQQLDVEKTSDAQILADLKTAQQLFPLLDTLCKQQQRYNVNYAEGFLLFLPAKPH